MDDLIELKAVSVVYYSDHDEVCFFDWLGKMPSVKRFHGRGDTLHLFVDKAAVTQGELLDLLGFFHRYGISMAQLAVFDTPEFCTWFRHRDTYWYRAVFNATQ